MDPMMTTQPKDIPKNGVDVDAVQTSEQDFAVGSQDELTGLQSLRSYSWRSFFRSVLLQMILFGLLSLVGPAMSDAITNLGGGGLDSPWLANLSTCLSYACSFLCTLIGGPLINKIGIKWSCFIAAVAMPLHGSAFYVDSKYDVDWFLLLGNIIKGSTAGFLYVAETTAMLSYPKPEDRGFYLGIWSAMRSSGSVIGGAINFSTNYDRASAGGIAWSTYLIFVGCECTGVLWALSLSSTRKVRRRDGSKVPTSGTISWKQEFAALWEHYKMRRTWLICIPSFYSFFYGGTMGTYLSLHFSVRARALSSLLVPSITIPSVIIFGKLLDTKWCSQRRRAWTGIMVWIPLQAACFIWIGTIYKTGDSHPALDYEENTTAWIKAYLPYLILFVTGYWTQLQLYWILGTFSTDVKESSRSGGSFRAFETAGQAISYGLNSGGIAPQIPFYINAGLLVLVVPFVVCLIRTMPEAAVEVEGNPGESDIGSGGEVETETAVNKR